MKIILLLSLLATSGFSQTAEWIYYNKDGDTHNSVYRIKPDGTENELIMDNAGISDISEDGLKILFLDNNGIISLINSESMDTLTLDNGGVNARFTYDENVIIYYKSMTGNPNGDQLYKYSFLDSSEILIADSCYRFIDNGIMSPDKQKLVFFQTNQDSFDVVIADIQSGQTSTLKTVSGISNPFAGHSYWGLDGYIYLNLPDNNNIPQLFRIHSSNGSLTQLTEENESCMLLASNDTQLEKLAFAVNDTVTEYWLYDFESNETSYLGHIEGSTFPTNQTWSNDNSKIAIGGVWATGIYTPGPINIFDTVADSFTTLVDSTWPPCFWVGDTGEYDCTADDGTEGVELWGVCYSIENTTELYLSGSWNNPGELTGEIPPEIGNLTNLTELRLDYNQLTGEIPPEIWTLTNLTILDLGINQLTGSIPPEIGNLTNLTELVLFNNQLTGSIPPEIGNLTNLTELVLFQNELTGSIPPGIGNLTNLTELVLEENQLTGSIPPEIGNLTNLGILILSVNGLTGSISPEIGNLTNLTILRLSSNQFTGSIPSEIGNLTNLISLNLHSNQLTGEIPSEIGNLTNLERIKLHSNQFTGSIPETLCNLPNLTWSLENSSYSVSTLFDNQLCPPYPSCVEYYVGEQDTTNCGQVSIIDETLPVTYKLYNAYPNPFNPVTTLRYDIPEDAVVNITIYDMMGRVVSNLVSSQQNAGYKSVQWNATNNEGQPVSAGLYLYTIQAGNFRQTKKMVLLK